MAGFIRIRRRHHGLIEKLPRVLTVPVGTVRLKPGREKSVLRRHPWIFSGAVLEEIETNGPWVQVTDDQGKILGYGLHNPKSQIRVRMWTNDSTPPDFPQLIRDRIAAARTRRAQLLADTDAVRYVNGEGDFMPGVVLDKYGGTLVLQLLTGGSDKIRDEIVHAIRSCFDEPVLFEKNVGRKDEELPDQIGVVYGEPASAPIQIQAGGMKFLVDIHSGHKTGFYLDQRKNLRLLKEILDAGGAGDRRLLDCFCYTGLFGVSLGQKFSRVTFVDGSGPALELCKKNFELNATDQPRVDAAEFICTDAFQYLRRESIGPFDAVVLDPPSFAKRKSDVEGACRGYKDIQRLAMTVIRPGGFLAAFGCSQHIDADLFQKVVFAAAIDAGRQAQILSRFGPDIDHPVSIDHPEGDYLKGLFLRIL